MIIIITIIIITIIIIIMIITIIITIIIIVIIINNTLSLNPNNYDHACCSMLLGTRRTATVVAAENSELYSFSRSALDSLLATWPEMARQFEVSRSWSLGVCGFRVLGF